MTTKKTLSDCLAKPYGFNDDHLVIPIEDVRKHIQSFLKKAKEEMVTPYKTVEMQEKLKGKNIKLLCFIDINKLDTLAKEEFGSLAEVRKGDEV